MGTKKLPDTEYLRLRVTEAVTKLNGITENTAEKMRTANTERWIWTMLSVSGSSLSLQQVASMINGECIPDATIEESLLVDACLKLRTEFDILCGMRTEPNAAVARSFHSIISGSATESDYRKGTPRLKDMDHTPPHGSEIPKHMRKMEIEIAAADEDAISSAVHMHDMIMSIWPFNDYNEATAYAIMSYKLLLSGYPLPAINLTAYEHRRLAAEFTHVGTSNGILSMLLINLINECRIPELDT